MTRCLNCSISGLCNVLRNSGLFDGRRRKILRLVDNQECPLAVLVANQQKLLHSAEQHRLARILGHAE
jgi:hypothetical protein